MCEIKKEYNSRYFIIQNQDESENFKLVSSLRF